MVATQLTRTRRRRPNRRSRESRWSIALPPVLTILGFIGLWWAVVEVFNIATDVIASPPQVVRELGSSSGLLMQNLWPTVFETVLGFILGNLVAIVLAVVFVYSKSIERSIFPVVVFVRMIPIVAVAPVLVVIFGTGYTPKVVIAALISFFPTLVNMVKGLKAADPQALELFHVLSASKQQVFFKLRWFSALPYLFASLRIASTTSVIGAVVAEWIGSQTGLGFLIVQSTYNFNIPLLYATMVVTAVFASIFYLLVGIVERVTVRWDASDALP